MSILLEKCLWGYLPYLFIVPTLSPLNVRGFLDSSERINITWQPVPLEQHNGIILGYRVVYGTQGGLHKNVTVNVTTLSVALGNLQTYTLYHIRVAAFTVIGDGILSDAITVRSQEGGRLYKETEANQKRKCSQSSTTKLDTEVKRGACARGSILAGRVLLYHSKFDRKTS